MDKKLDRQDTHEGFLNKAEQLQAIMEAGRRIHSAVDGIDGLVAARLGVHRNDLRCLHFLDDRTATPGELAIHTGLTSGSVTALIDRLESAGFVERRRCCIDRRSVEIAMSSAKLAAFRAIETEIETTIRGHFERLPVADTAQTATALGTFVAALDTLAARLAAGLDTPPA